MPLRTIIVEDEAPSRERLKSLLADFDDIDLVGEAHNGPDGVQLIDSLKPDLAFLDIQLPVYTSFEIIQKIKHHPYIIFVTAYDEYAIKAFEANAVDYLLKPTTSERLREAVDRVKKRQPSEQTLLKTLQSILQRDEYLDRFTVKIGDEILLIPAGDVFWFKAEDKYVFLQTADKNYIYDATLKELEHKLDPNVFCRIHKSVIIAQSRIQKIVKSFTGKYCVKMDDPKRTRFEIGRTYLAGVRKLFDF